MTHDVTCMSLLTVQQNFLAQALTIYSGRFKDQARFEMMFCPAALIIRDETRHRQRIPRLVKIDDLAVDVRLKRCKGRKEINGFEHACLALSVAPDQHRNPPWEFHIQAGEAAKVGK